MKKPAIIFGVNITPVTLADLLQNLGNLLISNSRAIITHVHITGLNIAYENLWFKNFLNNAEINYCDGMGVKLASKFLGCPLPERCTLVDWLPEFARQCEKNQKSWFFLGNSPGSPDRAADIFSKKYPSLAIVGAHHGFFNLTYDHPDNSNIIREINKRKPDVLFVGLGMPDQEKWIYENWYRLNVTMAMTCGGTFDTLAGINKRGPAWMTQNYLEWLARLIYSPNKYSKRYLRDIPLFFFRLIKQKIQD